MSKKQSITQPTLKSGVGYPNHFDYFLIFKNQLDLDNWVEHFKPIQFADKLFLYGGKMIQLQIEPSNPKTEPAKPAERIPFSAGKSQSSAADGLGRISKPF